MIPATLPTVRAYYYSLPYSRNANDHDLDSGAPLACHGRGVHIWTTVLIPVRRSGALTQGLGPAPAAVARAALFRGPCSVQIIILFLSQAFSIGRCRVQIIILFFLRPSPGTLTRTDYHPILSQAL